MNGVGDTASRRTAAEPDFGLRDRGRAPYLDASLKSNTVSSTTGNVIGPLAE